MIQPQMMYMYCTKFQSLVPIPYQKTKFDDPFDPFDIDNSVNSQDEDNPFISQPFNIDDHVMLIRGRRKKRRKATKLKSKDVATNNKLEDQVATKDGIKNQVATKDGIKNQVATKEGTQDEGDATSVIADSEIEGAGRELPQGKMLLNSLTLQELHPCDINLSSELIVDPTIDIPVAKIPMETETSVNDLPPSVDIVEYKDGTVLEIPEEMKGKVNIGALRKVKVDAAFAKANVNMIQVGDSDSDEPQQRGHPLFRYLARHFRGQGDNTHDHLSRFYKQMRRMDEINRFHEPNNFGPRNYLFDQFREIYPGRPCAQLLRYHERMRVLHQLLEQHGYSDSSYSDTSESSVVQPSSSSSESIYPSSDYSNSVSTTDASTTFYIGDASSGSSSRSNHYATTIDDWWTSIWTEEELEAMDAEA